MERYNDEYGYWKTLWWLVRRFATAPFQLAADLLDDWREVLDAIKTVLIALMLLCGPLMIVFTPFIAAWKQYDKRKRATQAAKQPSRKTNPMTHTSTEQPEALRLAEELRECHPSKLTELKAASVIISQHARILELEAQTAHMADLVELADYATKKLEAAQAQRVALSDSEIDDAWEGATGGHSFTDKTRRDFVRAIEKAHGITQEKQG